MDSRTQSKCTDSKSPIVGRELPPRIPPGEYEAVCYDVETGRSWGGRKDIYIRFRVHGSDYDGTELYLVCTYDTDRIGLRHKYFKQWALAAGRCPAKNEQLPATIFKNRLFRVRVRYTDRREQDGSRLPDFLQYSVVDSIIEPLTGRQGCA
jgi:hypothetical protein